MKYFLCLLVCVIHPVFLGAQTFSGKVRPILATHCFACHNSKLKSAELNLESFATDAQAEASPDVWGRVLEKLETGKMPPPGVGRLSAAEMASVKEWVEPLTRRTPANRVSIRRLNRVEYHNTVRDLLGIPARPAENFPMDDSGYGFDNIADVLSLPPMLMEKYMDSAKQLSRLAVYGEPVPAAPSTIGHYLAKRSRIRVERFPPGTSRRFRCAARYIRHTCSLGTRSTNSVSGWSISATCSQNAERQNRAKRS